MIVKNLQICCCYRSLPSSSEVISTRWVIHHRQPSQHKTKRSATICPRTIEYSSADAAWVFARGCIFQRRYSCMRGGLRYSKTFSIYYNTVTQVTCAPLHRAFSRIGVGANIELVSPHTFSMHLWRSIDGWLVSCWRDEPKVLLRFDSSHAQMSNSETEAIVWNPLESNNLHDKSWNINLCWREVLWPDA